MAGSELFLTHILLSVIAFSLASLAWQMEKCSKMIRATAESLGTLEIVKEIKNDSK